MIRGFHTDNGSECVNQGTDRLLKRLQIDFTRSRARRSNDNALVESKNGSSIRTTLGNHHIPRLFDAEGDVFVHKVLSPHLNHLSMSLPDHGDRPRGPVKDPLPGPGHRSRSSPPCPAWNASSSRASPFTN